MSILQGLARIGCAFAGHSWSDWKPSITRAWLFDHPGQYVDCEVGRYRECFACGARDRQTYDTPQVWRRGEV